MRATFMIALALMAVVKGHSAMKQLNFSLQCRWRYVGVCANMTLRVAFTRIAAISASISPSTPLIEIKQSSVEPRAQCVIVQQVRRLIHSPLQVLHLQCK